MTDIAFLPPATHVRLLEQFISRQRNVYIHLHKGKKQRDGLDDCASATRSLEVLKRNLKPAPECE